MLLVAGCGRIVVEERGPDEPPSAGGSSGAGGGATVTTGLAPGWYDVPADPSEPWGLVTFEQAGDVLAGQFLYADAAPAGTYQLAVAWKGQPSLTVVGSVSRGTTSFRALLQPPASALEPSTCGAAAQRARGTLFVLFDPDLQTAGDELVVASSTADTVLTQQVGSTFELLVDGCVTGRRLFPPLVLAREPRLELTRCRALGGPCADVDPVRVSAATVEVVPEGVRLSTTFVFGAPRLELNGAPLVVDAKGLLSRAQFVPGRNHVTCRLDGHPAWEADVVLPEAPLSPSMASPLSLGRSFSLSWSGGTWANSARVRLWPVDAPWTRAVYPSFDATSSPLTGTFAGFPDGRGGVVTGTRASLELTLTREARRFSVSQVERLEVPIAP